MMTVQKVRHVHVSVTLMTPLGVFVGKYVTMFIDQLLDKLKVSSSDFKVQTTRWGPDV